MIAVTSLSSRKVTSPRSLICVAVNRPVPPSSSRTVQSQAFTPLGRLALGTANALYLAFSHFQVDAKEALDLLVIDELWGRGTIGHRIGVVRRRIRLTLAGCLITSIRRRSLFSTCT